MATAWKQHVNNAGSTLAATITNSQTALAVAAGHGGKFPASGPFWITIFGTTVEEGNEIILVGARSGDNFTDLSRGEQGSLAAQWTAGANVQLLWTAGAVDQIQDAIEALETGTVLTDLTYTGEVQVRKAASVAGPTVQFNHSRGTVAAPSATQAADPVGTLLFQGLTGGLALSPLARIQVFPDGQNPANDDSPGLMVFQTTPNASATPATVLTLYSDKSATAGAEEIQVWDPDGYIPTAAIKTGTTNNGKVFTAGATEGSGSFQSILTVPDPTGHTGEFVTTTDGSTVSFARAFPDPTGHIGEFITTTDGVNLSFAAVSAGSPGPDTIGASEIKETEAITLLELVTSKAAAGDINGITLKHCRGTLGSPTSVASNDGTAILWQFTENTTYRNAAKIQVDVAISPGSDMPSNMGFWVCKDASAALPTDPALLIGQSQHVAIGDTDFSAAWFTVKGPTGTNLPACRFEQADQDEPFIDFVGTSAADGTKNISTAVEGAYAGKIRIAINGTDYWISYNAY